jgi:hypothetical protein
MADRPEEKRNFVRIDKTALVSFEVFPNAEPPIADMGLGLTVDLSLSGILIELPRTVNVGDGVRLTLNYKGKLIPALGKVVRTEFVFGASMQAGIRLTKVPAEYAAVVAHLQSQDGAD